MQLLKQYDDALNDLSKSLSVNEWIGIDSAVCVTGGQWGDIMQQEYEEIDEDISKRHWMPTDLQRD